MTPAAMTVAMIDDATWRELAALCERAYPREACGWLADTIRPATVGDHDAFAFSDEDLLALVAATRSPSPPRLLFHSHPDGDAELSAADRDALALHPLPHLVVAVAAGRARAATLYAWQGGAHVAVGRWSLP